ncbi:TetR/AcrR family transcriptional regulator [Streptomyces olivaceus]|uniref:TetR/AcrR family transcriptional regulator n=1 Tax=Streptomyces olivaceus TaxID=47716 RepID=UPI001CCA9C53|nr:TetR/AcrR family transcriptional regulator [Streptomyces olivaceus]MBZ6173624.1 TetR/AcrR family transcriptional regulator [Streptomyces olivaceus]MBZ6179461.1 TetR/AcrR family transcriptional regulator [Streptomyces olivaceus]
MTVPTGRRERKKAATRQKIADAAMRLFLERGYDAVGIRDVAAEADVAVTTLFSHFAAKEALVFEQDQDFEQRLTGAVTGRAPDEPLLPALRREIRALVRHCTAEGAAPVWRMIAGSPALREYEESMRLRHADSLAAAVAADPGLPLTPTACRTLARFVVDAYSLAREAADPDAAVDEIFSIIEAAWEVAVRERGEPSGAGARTLGRGTTALTKD